MRIALVHDHLNQIGGAELVLKALSELYPEAPIYTLIYNSQELQNYFQKTKIRTSFIQKLPLSLSRFKWYLPLMPAAIESLDFSGFDLVLSSASAFAKGVITDSGTLHFCYCHTPTRYLWSDTHQYTQELFEPWLVKKFLPFILTSLRIWDFQAAQRVDKFITNSYFVSQRIKKYYGRESQVIYPPVSLESFYLSKEIENYYLMITRLRPYKRVDIAIQAFNRLKIPLKIIGEGEEEKRLKKMAKPNIEFLGRVREETKRKYLSHSKAFIHPQEEDFGIAAVEAMASGRPVIAYKAGGVLETVREGFSGKFFDEQSWEALGDAVIRFKSEDWDPKRIKESVQKFAKERFKKEIVEFVSQALNG